MTNLPNDSLSDVNQLPPLPLTEWEPIPLELELPLPYKPKQEKPGKEFQIIEIDLA